MEIKTLDIRPVPPREKHPTIFKTFDELNNGESFQLINDHDPMPLYYQFYEDQQNNKERFHIAKAAGSLQIPFLIIHGTNDEAVLVDEAKRLHKAAKKSELYMVEGAGHTFGVKHPFVEDHFVCLFVAMPVLCSQMDAVSSTVTFLLDSVGLHHSVEGWDAEQ